MGLTGIGMESGPKIQVMAAITAMSAIWNVVKDFFFVVVIADMIISSLKCIVKNKTGSIIKEAEQIVNLK